MNVNRIEIHPAGLAVFTPEGECVATVTLTSGVGDAKLLILAKDAPAVEVDMVREDVRRFEDVVHRVGLEALFARTADPIEGRVMPRVPRAPHFPS